MDHAGAQFTAINSLRTGNVIVDMGVAMTLPAIFRMVFDTERLARVKRWFLGSKGRAKGGAYRTISCLTKGSSGWLGLEQKNHLLQKALKLYLTEACGVEFPTKAQVQLTAMHDTRYQQRYDPENPMADYRLTWIAADNEWVEVSDGVFFRQYKAQEGNNNGNQNNGGNNAQVEQFCIFELFCDEPDGEGAKKIDAFLNAAVEWYKAEMARLKDDSRWMYTMTSSETVKRKRSDGKEDSIEAFRYKRYQLSEQKTFESLFFPQKAGLLRLLSDFMNKEGKYAVGGFPHKMGLLLHGPPGTGKTSLIKALAAHTRRSIINVSLAQIETNAQLQNVMFDLCLDVIGADSAAKLSFDDVIFVMEDIDACSKIVQRRDVVGGGSATSAGDASSDDERSSAGRGSSTVTCSEMGSRLPFGLSPPPPLEGAAEGPFEWRSMGSTGRSRWSDPDELNLAGLLNVLDGVVDTPGRMLIMTSNHPDKLDPALIRPGRIDRCLLLDYVRVDEAAEMIAHYFGGAELNAEQHSRLAKMLGDRRVKMTPATMEQLCAEYDSVDELLDALPQCIDDNKEGGRLSTRKRQRYL